MESATNAFVDDFAGAPRRGDPEFGHGLRAALAVVREVVDAPTEVSAMELVTPELALVCPELRRQAIELLPTRDPEGFIPQRRPAAPEVVEAARNDRVVTQQCRPSLGRLMVAGTTYVAVEAGRMAVFGAVAIGGTAAVVTLMTLAAGA